MRFLDENYAMILVKCMYIWCALVCFALPSCEHNLFRIDLTSNQINAHACERGTRVSILINWEKKYRLLKIYWLTAMISNKGCKLANEMTQDLCISGDEANFYCMHKSIQVVIGIRFLSFSERFYEVDVIGKSVYKHWKYMCR
jgi:hypothetical protein